MYENSSSGSQVIPCGWTYRHIDMTKLIVVIQSFANAPKKHKQTKFGKHYAPRKKV